MRYPSIGKTGLLLAALLLTAVSVGAQRWEVRREIAEGNREVRRERREARREILNADSEWEMRREIREGAREINRDRRERRREVRREVRESYWQGW
jgi:hypothetical protein